MLLKKEYIATYMHFQVNDEIVDKCSLANSVVIYAYMHTFVNNLFLCVYLYIILHIASHFILGMKPFRFSVVGDVS